MLTKTCAGHSAEKTPLAEQQPGFMRVLMLCSSYPRFAEDSASVFLRHLALALSGSGADLQVLAPDHAMVSKSLQDPGIQLAHFRYFPRRRQTLAYGAGILPNLRRHPWRWFQIPFFIVAMFTSLFTACLRKRPDIIHAHWVLPQGLVAVWVGKLLAIPVVTSAHGSDVYALRGGLLAALKRYTLRHSRAWTANTKSTALCADPAGNIPPPHIIPMGVDVTQFHAPERSGIPDPERDPPEQLVLFVGRLEKVKGVSDLIRAFALLPENLLTQTRLCIAGEGTERPALEHLAQELGIAARVQFTGRVPHDALPGYHKSARLFAAPSITDRHGDTEGQGVAIVEAMASGLPVVASRSGGIKDVISHDETGLLVEPGDPRALSSAIATLLSDPEKCRRLGAAGRSRAQKYYSWEVVAGKFLEVYSGLSGEKLPG